MRSVSPTHDAATGNIGRASHTRLATTAAHSMPAGTAIQVLRPPIRAITRLPPLNGRSGMPVPSRGARGRGIPPRRGAFEARSQRTPHLARTTKGPGEPGPFVRRGRRQL